MSYDLVYLVGPPGVGKSSVMAALTARCDRLTAPGPLPHDVLLIPRDDDGNCDVGVEIGRRRESFSGTDALGMGINPKAVEWISARPHRLVLGEGARLANVAFLTAARSAGYTVHLVHLDAPAAVLGQRRADRGSHQTPAWVRGAATRASRIMDRMAMDAQLYHRSTDGVPAADTAAGLRLTIPALGVLG